MARRAFLITPRGKKIELPPEIYRQVRHLLETQTRHQTRAKIDRTLRETYGKFRGGTLLTQALLAERHSEQAREDAKLRALRG